MSDLRGVARGHVCLAGVGSRIGPHRLITGSVSVETTKPAYDGKEFRLLCLESSVISLISPSSGGSPRPI